MRRDARQILLPLFLAGVAAAEEAPPKLDPLVPQFVERYCLDCHDGWSEKGDRNFEPFLEGPDDSRHHLTLVEILDQLNLGEMPPDKKDVAQPTLEERREAVTALTGYLEIAAAAEIPTATVLRRLTRYEYKNTIRDLLGIDTAAADLTRAFPADPRRHGFANLGSAQALSEHHLAHYMEAARGYLDMALVFGKEQPATGMWTFAAEDFNGEVRNVGTVRYRVWGKNREHLDIGHGQPADRGVTYPRAFATKGVPLGGLYRIRLKATAVGREHPYDPGLFPNDLSVPLKLALWHAPDARLLEKSASEGRVLVDVFDLPDNETAELEATAWMPAGSVPFVNWINGPGSSKRILRMVTESHHPEAERRSPTRIDQLREQGLPVPEDALVQKVWISEVYEGPRVRLFEMTLEGPLMEAWPPAGHRRIVGSETDASMVDVRAMMTRFAGRAFRRPVAESEIAHHSAHVGGQIAKGSAHAEAIKQGLTALLVSPRFLFLDEGNPEDGSELDDYQLASRLSYFLWTSMPDERLMELAARGEMKNAEVLAREVDRMIADPRSAAFAEHFSDAWLRLDKIGSMPPSNAQFPAYDRDRLESAMKSETRMLVAHILKENRPVTDFLDGRYSFLNDALAKHYGIEGVTGERFRKVALPAGSRRGGLLGHASVLTASANGVETSPVVRGIWILESILGTPPPPPPPDVPPIEPDTRGATTIREQLAKHRDVAACADCHAKIDPWGFALEYFDPVGGFREHYPVFTGSGRIANRADGKPVDGAGELPSGEFIRDERDLRNLLLGRMMLVTKNLARKLLAHATGREPTFRDEPEIERIVREHAASGHGMRDLVHGIVQSEVFARR